MRLSVITQPYNTRGKGQGGGAGPGVLLDSGLVAKLRAQGHEVGAPVTVELSEEQRQAYGDWERVANANARLADLVASSQAEGLFVLGLLADCNSVLGTLGGLTRSEEPGWPRRVGLIWVDAHADYNTPNTSPSGMLGGMPVAVAAGKCLPRLRHRSGLRVPLQQPDIVMVGLRDVDALERAALDSDGIVSISENDLVEGTDRLDWALHHLSAREDVLHVHVDLDILDPTRAPAAGLPSEGGLTGAQLGRGLARLLRHPKVGALAMVSYKADRDDTGETLAEVSEAILGATEGLLAR